jgi:hypothetical protein
VVCKDSFSNPWDLMVHAQAAHMVNIYEIGESDEEDDSNTSNKSNKLDKTNGESHNNINGSSCNGTAMHSNENVSHFILPTLALNLSAHSTFFSLKYLCKKYSGTVRNFHGWKNNKNSTRRQKRRKISFRGVGECGPGKKLNGKAAQNSSGGSELQARDSFHR